MAEAVPTRCLAGERVIPGSPRCVSRGTRHFDSSLRSSLNDRWSPIVYRVGGERAGSPRCVSRGTGGISTRRCAPRSMAGGRQLCVGWAVSARDLAGGVFRVGRGHFDSSLRSSLNDRWSPVAYRVGGERAGLGRASVSRGTPGILTRRCAPRSMNGGGAGMVADGAMSGGVGGIT